MPAVIWVRRRPRRVYAAVGLLLLAPLALAPAWSPRDLVWPAVFGYLGDARWASIYAVAAGACVGWTSTWWGTGLPWAAGVNPGTVPDGTIAGLGLVTWVVLGSWLFLGWRTVAVEAGAETGKAGAVPAGAVGNGVVGEGMVGEGVVDNQASRSRGWATLPVGAPGTGGSGSGVPGSSESASSGSATRESASRGSASSGSASSGSVSLPK